MSLRSSLYFFIPQYSSFFKTIALIISHIFLFSCRELDTNRQKKNSLHPTKKNPGKEVSPYFNRAEFIFFFSTTPVFPIVLMGPHHCAGVLSQANEGMLRSHSLLLLMEVNEKERRPRQSFVTDNTKGTQKSVIQNVCLVKEFSCKFRMILQFLLTRPTGKSLMGNEGSLPSF